MQGVTGNAFGRKDPAFMPRFRVPQYRCYKPKNLGLVVIRGKPYYLGKFGSEESWERYRRLIAEFLATPSSPAPIPTSSASDAGLTVNDLLVAYWDRYVTSYYLKDGRPTSEQDNIKQALRFLRRLFGNTPARDFGPKSLALVRDAMIQA